MQGGGRSSHEVRSASAPLSNTRSRLGATPVASRDRRWVCAAAQASTASTSFSARMKSTRCKGRHGRSFARPGSHPSVLASSGSPTHGECARAVSPVLARAWRSPTQSSQSVSSPPLSTAFRLESWPMMAASSASARAPTQPTSASSHTRSSSSINASSHSARRTYNVGACPPSENGERSGTDCVEAPRPSAMARASATLGI